MANGFGAGGEPNFRVLITLAFAFECGGLPNFVSENPPGGARVGHEIFDRSRTPAKYTL
jgi:hypothetical protein